MIMITKVINFFKNLFSEQYRYFVSYNFTDNDKLSGIGNSIVILPKKIETLEEITEIEKMIKNKTGFDFVNISNLVLL